MSISTWTEDGKMNPGSFQTRAWAIYSWLVCWNGSRTRWLWRSVSTSALLSFCSSCDHLWFFTSLSYCLKLRIFEPFSWLKILNFNFLNRLLWISKHQSYWSVRAPLQIQLYLTPTRFSWVKIQGNYSYGPVLHPPSSIRGPARLQTMRSNICILDTADEQLSKVSHVALGWKQPFLGGYLQTKELSVSQVIYSHLAPNLLPSAPAIPCQPEARKQSCSSSFQPYNRKGTKIILISQQTLLHRLFLPSWNQDAH